MTSDEQYLKLVVKYDAHRAGFDPHTGQQARVSHQEDQFNALRQHITRVATTKPYDDLMAKDPEQNRNGTTFYIHDPRLLQPQDKRILNELEQRLKVFGQTTRYTPNQKKVKKQPLSGSGRKWEQTMDPRMTIRVNLSEFLDEE